MHEQKLLIPILLGTTREGRKSEEVAQLIATYIGSREDIDTQIVDVRDFEFKDGAYGQDVKENFPEWRDLMKKADGLIIVVPEYNHGYPGPLKSVLDLLHHDEYGNKVVGFVGVSAGAWGGTRVIENLLPVVRELKLVAVRGDLQFPKVNGGVETEGVEERIDRFLNNLLFTGRSLKWGRENLSA